MDWCDKNNIEYLIGITRNSRLESMTKHLMEKAVTQFESTGEKQRVFGDLIYVANSWKYERRIVAKAEYSAKGKNPRFIVTFLLGDGQSFYEKHYCARGDQTTCFERHELIHCLLRDYTIETF